MMSENSSQDEISTRIVGWGKSDSSSHDEIISNVGGLGRSDSASPEDILRKIGGWGRFQKLLFVIIHLVKIPSCFSMFLMVLSIARPRWWCADNPDPDTGGGNLSSVGHVTNYVEPDRFQSCHYQNASTCKDFVYDPSMNTILSEWDMACELSWVPSMIASLQYVGLLVGNVLCGHVADHVGRKRPLFLSWLIIGGASLIGYFATGWQMFAVARVLIGVGMGWHLTVHYSILTETTLADMRPWVMGVPSWNLEGCLFCLIGYLVSDWRKLHLVVAVLTLPCFAAWWFIPESFRWYMSHDRRDDARDVIKYIAKTNGHDVADDVIDEIFRNMPTTNARGNRKKYTVVDMFKTKHLTKTTVLLTLNWFALGLVTYGITFGIEALSGNFFLNTFIFNVLSIPTHFLIILLTNRFGRRKSIMLCYSVVVVSGLVVGIIQHVGTTYRGTLTNVFATIAYLGVVMLWCPVPTMTQELYPTVIRFIAYGFMNMCTRVGAIISPQLAFLDSRVSGIMYFLCSFISVLCVLGTLRLAETKDKNLSDGMELQVKGQGHEYKQQPLNE